MNLRRALSVLLSIMVKKGQCALINESTVFESQVKLFFNFKWYKLRSSSIRIFMVFSKMLRGILTNRVLTKDRRSLFPIFPHIFFVSSTLDSFFVIRECFKLKLPSIALADTAKFPLEATFKVPANEKGAPSVIFFNTVIFLFAIKAYFIRSNQFSERILRIYKSSFHREKGIIRHYRDLDGVFPFEILRRRKSDKIEMFFKSL